MKPKNPAIRNFRSLMFVGSAAALLAFHSAQAGTITWDSANATTTSWALGSNWIGGVAPVNGDDVFVTSDGAFDPTNYNGAELNSLTLSGANSLTLNGLKVGAGGVFNTMLGAGQTLFLNGTTTLLADQTWGGTRTILVQQATGAFKLTFNGSFARFDTNSAGWSGGLDVRTTVGMGGNYAVGAITPFGTGTVTLINQRSDGLTSSSPILGLAGAAANNSLANANTIANNIALSDPGTGNFTITQNNDAAPSTGHFYILSGNITGAVNSARTLSFTNTHGSAAATLATFVLTGTNTFTAQTIVGANTTLSLSNNLNLQNSVLSTTTGTVILEPTVTAPTFGGLAGSGALATTGAVTTITLNTGTGVVASFSGDIPEGATGMTLTKSGGGTQTLSGNNSFSGGVDLTAGNLTLGSATALGAAAGTFKIGGGTTFDSSVADLVISNNNPATINGDFTFTGTQNLDLGTGAISLGTAAGTSRTITVSAKNLTLGGNITDGTTANQLVKTGTGTLTLSGASSYTGGTTFSGGLIVGAQGALGNGNLATTSTSTLAFDTPTNATFSNAMNLVAPANNSIRNNSTASTVTLNGNMVATATDFFAFVGTGVDNAGFVLGGSNTFTSTRLVVKDTSLTIANNGAVNAPGFQRVSLGDSGGSGAAVYLVDGINLNVKVVDSNNNDITGPMAFTVGMKTAGTATFSGTASANVAVDLHVRSTGGTSNAWNFEAVSGATANFTGKIINSGTNAQAPITKTGAGTVVFSAVNTYTADTTVSEGTLGFAGGSQASPITVASDAFLQFSLASSTSSTSSLTLDSGAKIKISGAPVSPADYTLITASGGITGTPVLASPISGYSLVLESSNTVLKLKFTGGGANYSTWASAFSAPVLSNTAALADPDNDGLTNAVEYALGLDPRFSSASPGVSSNSGKTITFTKGTEAKANGDVTYKIETSATLAAGSWVEGISPVVTETADTIVITFPNGPVKNFARLKVTVAP